MTIAASEFSDSTYSLDASAHWVSDEDTDSAQENDKYTTHFSFSPPSAPQGLAASTTVQKDSCDMFVYVEELLTWPEAKANCEVMDRSLLVMKEDRDIKLFVEWTERGGFFNQWNDDYTGHEDEHDFEYGKAGVLREDDPIWFGASLVDSSGNTVTEPGGNGTWVWLDGTELEDQSGYECASMERQCEEYQYHSRWTSPYEVDFSNDVAHQAYCDQNAFYRELCPIYCGCTVELYSVPQGAKWAVLNNVYSTSDELYNDDFRGSQSRPTNLGPVKLNPLNPISNPDEGLPLNMVNSTEWSNGGLPYIAAKPGDLVAWRGTYRQYSGNTRFLDNAFYRGPNRNTRLSEGDLRWPQTAATLEEADVRAKSVCVAYSPCTPERTFDFAAALSDGDGEVTVEFPHSLDEHLPKIGLNFTTTTDESDLFSLESTLLISTIHSHEENSGSELEEHDERGGITTFTVGHTFLQKQAFSYRSPSSPEGFALNLATVADVGSLNPPRVARVVDTTIAFAEGSDALLQGTVAVDLSNTEGLPFDCNIFGYHSESDSFMGNFDRRLPSTVKLEFETQGADPLSLDLTLTVVDALTENEYEVAQTITASSPTSFAVTMSAKTCTNTIRVELRYGGLTWADARDHCDAEGMRLPIIRSAEDGDRLERLFDGVAFIGLTKIGNKWEWIDDTSLPPLDLSTADIYKYGNGPLEDGDTVGAYYDGSYMFVPADYERWEFLCESTAPCEFEAVLDTTLTVSDDLDKDIKISLVDNEDATVIVGLEMNYKSRTERHNRVDFFFDSIYNDLSILEMDLILSWYESGFSVQNNWIKLGEEEEVLTLLEDMALSVTSDSVSIYLGPDLPQLSATMGLAGDVGIKMEGVLIVDSGKSELSGSWTSFDDGVTMTTAEGAEITTYALPTAAFITTLRFRDLAGEGSGLSKVHAVSASGRKYLLVDLSDSKFDGYDAPLPPLVERPFEKVTRLEFGWRTTKDNSEWRAFGWTEKPDDDEMFGVDFEFSHTASAREGGALLAHNVFHGDFARSCWYAGKTFYVPTETYDMDMPMLIDNRFFPEQNSLALPSSTFSRSTIIGDGECQSVEYERVSLDMTMASEAVENEGETCETTKMETKWTNAKDEKKTLVDVGMSGCGDAMKGTKVTKDGKDWFTVDGMWSKIPQASDWMFGVGSIRDVTAMLTDGGEGDTGSIGEGACAVSDGCLGGQSCDEVINLFGADGKLTCSVLEQDFGCSCSGCMCREETEDKCAGGCAAGLQCKLFEEGRGYIAKNDVEAGGIGGEYSYMCLPEDWCFDNDEQLSDHTGGSIEGGCASNLDYCYDDQIVVDTLGVAPGWFLSVCRKTCGCPDIDFNPSKCTGDEDRGPDCVVEDGETMTCEEDWTPMGVGYCQYVCCDGAECRGTGGFAGGPWSNEYEGMEPLVDTSEWCSEGALVFACDMTCEKAAQSCELLDVDVAAGGCASGCDASWLEEMKQELGGCACDRKCVGKPKDCTELTAFQAGCAAGCGQDVIAGWKSDLGGCKDVPTTFESCSAAADYLAVGEACQSSKEGDACGADCANIVEGMRSGGYCQVGDKMAAGTYFSGFSLETFLGKAGLGHCQQANFSPSSCMDATQMYMMGAMTKSGLCGEAMEPGAGCDEACQGLVDSMVGELCEEGDIAMISAEGTRSHYSSSTSRVTIGVLTPRCDLAEMPSQEEIEEQLEESRTEAPTMAPIRTVVKAEVELGMSLDVWEGSGERAFKKGISARVGCLKEEVRILSATEKVVRMRRLEEGIEVAFEIDLTRIILVKEAEEETSGGGGGSTAIVEALAAVVEETLESEELVSVLEAGTGEKVTVLVTVPVEVGEKKLELGIEHADVHEQGGWNLLDCETGNCAMVFGPLALVAVGLVLMIASLVLGGRAGDRKKEILKFESQEFEMPSMGKKSVAEGMFDGVANPMRGVGGENPMNKGRGRPPPSKLRARGVSAWEKEYDEGSKCDYYLNTATGETQWEQPDGWEGKK